MEGREGWRGGGGRWSGDVVMWCTGHRVGAEPACPGWCGCSTHTGSIHTALCSAHKGLGDGLRPSPSRQAHRPTPVSEGKGSVGRELGGQGARVQVHLSQRCKRVGTEVGIRCSPVSHLVFVLEIS